VFAESSQLMMARGEGGAYKQEVVDRSTAEHILNSRELQQTLRFDELSPASAFYDRLWTNMGQAFKLSQDTEAQREARGQWAALTAALLSDLRQADPRTDDTPESAAEQSRRELVVSMKAITHAMCGITSNLVLFRIVQSIQSGEKRSIENYKADVVQHAHDNCILTRSFTAFWEGDSLRAPLWVHIEPNLPPAFRVRCNLSFA
ncbi:hypothetical protein CYMTET_36138, partial [Cymbomonas tetramitiformis]